MSEKIMTLKNLNVGVITPSTAVSKENLAEAVEKLETIFNKVIVGKHVGATYGGYMAGSGEERGEDINEMFLNPEVDIILCLRGGFSSSQVMPYINIEEIRNNPKPFIGYSDITNFHLVFQQKCNLPTIHGPMGYSNMCNHWDDYTKEGLEKALFTKGEIVFKNPKDEEIKIYVEGEAIGKMTGGNLSLLASSIGTDYEIDTKGKILFIEEIEEEICRIDRMMTQLKHAKKLDDVEGIVLGDFTDCTNSYDPEYGTFQFFLDFFKEYKKPVMYNICSGHDFPMGTLPMGIPCKMNTWDKSIIFDNSNSNWNWL